MKNLLVLFVVIIVASAAFAQEESRPKLQRHLVAKFMPVNYALQSYSFEVEGMLNGKNSLILGVGIPNNQSLLNKYGIEPSEDLEKLNFSTMHVRAAYRHYTGKSMLPRGFYIEPYLKYQQLKADATINIGDDEPETTGMLRSMPIYSAVGSGSEIPTSADIAANFKTLNVGFQMGVQFLIAKRVSLDFYFLGLEGGILNGDLTGSPEGAAPEDIQDMRDEIDNALEDLPSFLREKITVTNTSTSVEVKAKQLPYPWLRGGISIGIAF